MRGVAPLRMSPATMKAIVVEGSAASKTLRLRDLPTPVPQSTELLVRVRAAGVNRSDLSRTQKHYAPSDIHIAGNEVSGEVIGMGESVEGFRIGDRVMALVNGGYAEQVCVDHRIALRVPENLAWAAAAAVPVNFMTAHDALCTAGRFWPGDQVLIHAVTSGVGIAAVMIAKQLGASWIMGTSRDAEKAAPLLELGLDSIIETSSGPHFADRVLAETGGAGAPVILDAVGGGGTLSENLVCAALQGRIVILGLMGGTTETLDLDTLARRRISLNGVSFRTRSLEDKQAVCMRFEKALGSRLAEGALKPIVFKTFPLAAALEAQDMMRSNVHLGKIVLVP